MKSYPIYNAQGLPISEIDLSFFDIKIDFFLIKQVVVWQLSKMRSGFHQTKNVSTIKATTAKPYRQKGTGRARQGSLRSPQFCGGSAVFGPNIRNYEYSINKKVVRKGLFHAISLSLYRKNFFILDSLDIVNHKTKTLLNLLKNMNFSSNSPVMKNILFINDNIKNLKTASRNIPFFNIIDINGLNVYDIIRNDYVFIDYKSMPVLLKLFGF